MQEPGSCSLGYGPIPVLTCSSWRFTVLGLGIKQAAHPEGSGCHHWSTPHSGCAADNEGYEGETIEELRAAREKNAADKAAIAAEKEHRAEFERASAAGELTQQQIAAENARVS